MISTARLKYNRMKYTMNYTLKFTVRLTRPKSNGAIEVSRITRFSRRIDDGKKIEHEAYLMYHPELEIQPYEVTFLFDGGRGLQGVH